MTCSQMACTVRPLSRRLLQPLDGMRALACISVVCFHVNFVFIAAASARHWYASSSSDFQGLHGRRVHLHAQDCRVLFVRRTSASLDRAKPRSLRVVQIPASFVPKLSSARVRGERWFRAARYALEGRRRIYRDSVLGF